MLANNENVWWIILSVEMSAFDAEIPMCLAIHHKKFNIPGRVKPLPYKSVWEE